MQHHPQGAIDPEVKAQQLQLLYKALPTSVLATLVNVSVLGALLWNEIDHAVLTGWVLLMALLNLGRLISYRCYRNADDKSDRLLRCEWQITVGALLSGIGWAVAGILLFAPASLMHQMFLTFIIAGMSAGAISSLASRLNTIYPFLALLLLPLAYSFFTSPLEGGSMMGAMILLYSAILSVSVKRIHDRIRQSIVHELESAGKSRALQQSEQRFRELFEKNKSVELIIDPHSAMIIDANHAAELFYGYPRSTLLTMKISEINTLPASLVAKEMEQARQEGRNHFFFKHRLASGELRDVEVHSGPINWQGREALYSIVHDISARVQAEDELAEARRRNDAQRLQFQAILDNSPLGIWLLGANGRLQFVNNTFCEAVGLSEAEFLAASDYSDILPETIAASCKRSDHECLEGDGPHTSYERIPFVDGDTHLLEITKIKVLDDDGKLYGVIGIAMDISERRQAEERLRKLSQAIQHAGEAITITDRNGVIEYVNPAFTEITGYSAEEVLGQNPRILNSGRQSHAFYKELWKTILSGRVWKSSMVERRKDGALYPAIMSISPILNDDGEITHFVGIQQDMSEHEELENRFRQAQKMEALGTLVGGIAHDFNNMLGGMTGNLFLLKRKLTDQPDLTRRLEVVENLSYRASEMIKQLLMFARKGILEMRPFGLTSFIKEVSKLNEVGVPENISFSTRFCSRELVVNGDATQLHQAIINLLNNARDALDGVESPRITMQLDEVEVDDLFLERHPALTSRYCARLAISDNGCGISKDHQERIFEPFYTSKEVGVGTGLGLAMAYGALESHGGCIDVESAPGEGATFTLYLPLVAEEKGLHYGDYALNAIVRGEGETLLIVDDNADIRASSSEVLESIGYRVLQAVDGLEAVELYEKHHNEIDLVVMDVIMPRLGGIKAAERMRRINADVKVIFTSGYDKDEVFRLEMPDDEYTLLSKPCHIETLSVAIREKLEA